MKDFKVSYDNESDDLFAYLEGTKSAGAVEIGDFIFDFDKEGDFVGMQILNASDVLSKLIKKMVSLSNLENARVSIINFRNMTAVEVSFKDEKESVPIIVPRVKKRSPVLDY